MGVHIFQYWESTPAAPPYVELCFETVQRHLGAAERVLLDEETIKDWLPDLDPSWRRFAEPAHRADYVRARLLERYGGIWLDADVIALKDLSGLYTEDAADVALLGWINVEGLIAVNLLAAPAGSPVVRAWVVAQQRILASEAARSPGPIEVSWSALGSDSITASATEGATRFLDPARVAPISWRDAEVFLRPARYALERVLSAEPTVVMLYNKMLAHRLANVSASDVLKGQTLLGALLRIGLEESTKEEEIKRSRRPFPDPRAWLHRGA